MHGWNPELYGTDNEKAKAKGIHKTLFSRPVVAIHVSAGLPYKMWPSENFAKLITMLGEFCSCDFALLGSSEDSIFAQSICELVKKNRVEDLTGKLSIRDAYFFLSDVRGFVGNDSVLAHFAGSLGVPVVELMNGAVDEKRWRAAGERVSVLTGLDKGHICALDKCKYPCPHMRAISTNEVFELMRKTITLENREKVS